MLDQTDRDLIIELATSSASLDASPKKNWVENAGGLPPYVRKLARAIRKTGKSLDQAIAIAISRIKVWAGGGGDVSAETRAKAAKALAQWEAAKAKNKVKLSFEDGTEYLLLTDISSFNTEIVRSAWDAIQREQREAYERAHPSQSDEVRLGSGFQYKWINELGTDYVIVRTDDRDGQTSYRIPYTVNEDYDVTFGQATKIRQIWVEDSDELTFSEKRGLVDVLVELSSPLDRITRVAGSLKKE